MHKQETKIITKKLRSGNFDFFLNTYTELHEQGWRKVTRAINDTQTVRVTMQKEVNIDSTEPDKSETNCRPISNTPYEALGCPLLEDNDESCSETSTESKISLTEAEEDLGGSDDSETIILSLEAAETIQAAIDNPPAPNEKLLEAAQNYKENGVGLQNTPQFEKRAYTKEELSTWPWAEVTKLGGLLGAGIGGREKREENIVSLSLAQWGGKSE